MKTYRHSDPQGDIPRSHPWNIAAHDPTHKYYDFKAQPELIRFSLEDFVPWKHYAAIERFYGLLEWINGPDSQLESNDCAFRDPSPNTNPNFSKTLQCSDRLMILYRDLKLNTEPEYIQWLTDASHHYLNQSDPDFVLGCVGTTIMQAHFTSLPPTEKQSGHQLQLLFWAWGDGEVETMGNLDRLFKNLTLALRGVSDEIRDSMKHG